MSKGFTLIELLVVVIIIGVLSGIVLSVINPTGLRSKARDAQRVSDLKKIQTSLELYFSDSRSYPASASWTVVTGADAALSGVLEPNYLVNVPSDPLGTGSCGGSFTPCDCADYYRYTYKTDTDGTKYVLTSIMEVLTSNDKNQCSDLNGWSSLGCGGAPFTTSEVCYGAENP